MANECWLTMTNVEKGSNVKQKEKHYVLYKKGYFKCLIMSWHWNSTQDKELEDIQREKMWKFSSCWLFESFNDEALTFSTELNG